MEGATRRYLEEYDKYIYKGKEAEISPITAEDLEYTAKLMQESAAGMDQWKGILPLLPAYIAASKQAEYIEICNVILQQVEDRHPVDAAGRTPLGKAREMFGENVFFSSCFSSLNSYGRPEKQTK